jgi:Skp family chaperone for outer membrane proteins
MSKTRSTNSSSSKSSRWARFLAAGVVSAATLCGCGVNVHASNIRGVAYVDVDKVIKHHPLYGQLQQLSDAMAAIDLQSSLPHAPLTAAQIKAQAQDLNQQMKDAQDRAQAAIAQLRTQYQEQERQADVDALKAAGIDPSAAGIGAQMSATSQQQAEAALTQAGKDYQAYQKSLVAQSNAAARAISVQLQKEAGEKLRARAMQYQQNENDLALQLAQQDAPQRVSLKTQLSTLALDPQQRTSAQAQLNALDKREQQQVNALHESDQRALAAYQKQVLAQLNVRLQQQLTAVRNQTNAKLSDRRDQLNAQLKGLSAPVPTVKIPPDVAKQLQQIHENFAQKFQVSAQQAVTQYNQAKSDLDAEFAALQQGDSAASGAAQNELNDLQQRRDALHKQMVDQVEREARRIAQKMGFSVVFEGVVAAPGGYDLTNDVTKDVESLHE